MPFQNINGKAIIGLRQLLINVLKLGNQGEN
jgi:hypothetical protein